MRWRLLTVFLASLAVAACSTTDQETTDSAAAGATDARASGGAGDAQVASRPLSGPKPGSQEDLVVNVGDRVFFGFDSYDLTPEGRSALEKQAVWLQSHPGLSITIAGHADERGTREYNLALGERRANAVRNYLVALGIPAARISTISFGKECPVALGSTDASWAQNRRGVTHVDDQASGGDCAPAMSLR